MRFVYSGLHLPVKEDAVCKELKKWISQSLIFEGLKL